MHKSFAVHLTLDYFFFEILSCLNAENKLYIDNIRGDVENGKSEIHRQ